MPQVNPAPGNTDPVETRRMLFRSRMAIVAAAVLWSTSGFFAKSTLFDDWPAAHRGLLLAFWRGLFAGLSILPLVRRPVFRWSLLPLGLTFTAMVGSYLTAMVLGTGANAIWIQYTAPWWVFLGGLWFFHEPTDHRALVTLIPAMVGVGFIFICELVHVRDLWGLTGIGCALISAFTYAGVVLQIRRLRHVDIAWLVVVNQAISVLVLLPFVIWSQVLPTPTQFLWLAAFGFFQLGLPYLLFSWGLRHIGGAEATVLSLIEPMLVPIWAFLIVGEVPAWWTMVGAAIILAGLIARYGGELWSKRRGMG